MPNPASPSHKPALSRRVLLLSALATTVGLASLRPAEAFDLRSGSDGRGDKPEPGGSGRLSKMLFRGQGNRQFGLTSVLVLDDSGAWYSDFTGRVLRRDEDRIGILRDIPLVGRFFTPTLRARDFSQALQIGLVFQLEETLLIDLHRSGRSRQQLSQALMSGQEPGPALSLAGASGPVRTIGAANQRISYFTVGGPPPVNPVQPPKPLRLLSNGAQAREIGRAYNKGETLLTVVNPSILTGWS